MKAIRYLVVHAAATPPERDIGVKEIRAMHLQRGFRDVGYHYVIRRDGRVEKGRPDNVAGAHVSGFNSISLGVCLVGGIDAEGRPEDNYTPAQYAALARLLRQLQASHPTARILGHRDLSPDKNGDGKVTPNEWLKACPCFDVRTWWAREQAA
ncbi:MULTISPECIES: N-acetylmuramoyl-L-alanine amidase [Brevundimonas]|uniref:N-acetylmuramoyl-L-alanine amidase n=1 Tax=Brevundimonas sp. UBA7507 TaxID=1946137 RepID=UPI00257F849B|nr:MULTISPECIES: N-acetylmuramoyl-L-alanine amidase [Brevundimonas]